MRILVVGDWHSELHEEPVYQAFKKLGHEVFRFSWHQYFLPVKQSGWRAPLERFFKKFQNKFICGPQVKAINRDFVKAVEQCQPDLVFVYRGTHITRRALRQVRTRFKGVFLAGYNNDDPFAKGHSYWLWRHFMPAVPEYDLMFAYRHHNLEDFRRAGARRVELLRSWYLPERNHPVELSLQDKERFGCDVVFVGHYESDGRLEALEEIVRAGFHLRLFGPGYEWDAILNKSPLLRHLAPVRLVWGDEYNRALCGAKVALCFLSKLNRDTYTRRCFEIPASGVLMLSESSDDLATLYKEAQEAAFFRSPGELVTKLQHYLEDDSLRKQVAAAGHDRVVADGHDVFSRMKRVVNVVTERQ